MWRERAGVLVTGLLFLLFCSIESAAGVADIPVTEVTKDLVCLCGDAGCPNLIVATCSCDDAHRITQDVQARLDAGKTKEQILAEFVSEQGERVLAAPPRRGWKNLTAWLLPFAMVPSPLGCCGAGFERIGRIVWILPHRPSQPKWMIFTGKSWHSSSRISIEMLELIQAEVSVPLATGHWPPATGND